MKTTTKLLSLLIGILILMSSCTELTEWMSGEEEDDTPPSEVTNLNAEALNQSVKLTWTNPIDSDFKSILIECFESPLLEYDYRTGQSGWIEDGSEEYTVKYLSNTIEYTFTVKSVDEAGNASKGIQTKAIPIN
jgi:hypothetical protein